MSSTTRTGTDRAIIRLVEEANIFAGLGMERAISALTKWDCARRGDFSGDIAAALAESVGEMAVDLLGLIAYLNSQRSRVGHNHASLTDVSPPDVYHILAEVIDRVRRENDAADRADRAKRVVDRALAEGLDAEDLVAALQRVNGNDAISGETRPAGVDQEANRES